MEVCPVECIVPGQPQTEWHWYYIDPSTCIDCGACIPECPNQAIFYDTDVPTAYEMRDGQLTVPHETGETFKHNAGDVVDLTGDIQYNYDFFEKGPSYDVLD